jgi:pyrroline-5-carboxylate reductase
MMRRIGFIGTGHIAAPMVRFLATRGHAVTVSQRNAEVAQALAASHGVTVTDNQAVVDASEIVFLCVRPHLAPQVLAELSFRAEHQVVSVMAGISLARLARACAPATDFTVTIPLGFVEKGGCPLACCPNAGVLEPLFAPDNPVVAVADEAAFIKHFAVCAFVPGVLDLMTTASDWLGAQTGNMDAAARYTRQLLMGFLAALPEGGAELLPQERDALATEGTLSLQMTKALRDGRAHDTLTEALSAIGDRLEGKS